MENLAPALLHGCLLMRLKWSKATETNLNMKTLILAFLLLGLSHSVSAQIISIQKIKAVPKSEFYTTKDSTLIFPVFTLKNKTAATRINQKLTNDFKQQNDIDKNETNVRSMLEKAGKESLTDLTYEIIYQTKKIISFYFFNGGMGAYPTTWRTFYCFNLETGNLITLDSLLQKTQKRNFLTFLKQKQSAKISAYKKDLLQQLKNKEFDKETYEWALNNVKNTCWDNYDPQKFTINKSTLTIVIDCDFPHAIQALAPESDIKIPLKQIEQYLDKRYRSLMH